MPLGRETVGKLRDFAVAGASLVSPAVGVSSGVIGLLAKGTDLAGAVRRDQQDKWETFLLRVRTSLEHDYGVWLKRECGEDWERNANVEAAFFELDQYLPFIRLDSEIIVSAGHKGEVIAAKLLEQLPKTSLIRTNDTAGRVFQTLVAGAFDLARSDGGISAELTSFSFERVFEEFGQAENNAERRHNELMSAIARERGVDPKHLRPLFEAVGHDANVLPDRYEQAIRSAVEALLERARDPVQPSNDGEAVDHAIRVARAKVAELDVEGAVAHLRGERARQAEERLSRARGEARLAVEEGDILREAYQHKAALAAYDQAAELDPDHLYALRRAGRSRLLVRALSDALRAFERFKEAAERLGNHREISVAHNEIGDVRRAQGNLTGALESHEASLAIAERLAEADPGNTGWQRDLSVSHDRIGNVRHAQGNLTGALESYEASLAIAERLAEADPGNTEWQRDLIVSHVRLAEAGETPAAHYQGALDVARELQGTGRLAPTDDWMVTNLEERLAAAKAGAVPPP